MNSFKTSDPGRLLSLITVGLLVILLIAQIGSILEESQTTDEGVHLSAGYSYWKTGDFRLNAEHPPLGKLIDALPLLLLNPRLPLDDPSWQTAGGIEFGKAFLYANRVPADTLLFWGRVPTILLTLCMGGVLVAWTRRHFSAPIAVFALTLFVFDPNIIAHGRYVTSDIPVAFVVFLATVVWSAYVARPTFGRLVVVGLTLGLALLTKASAVILVPIFVVLYAIKAWQEKHQQTGTTASLLSLKRLFGALAVCAILAFGMVWAGYGFEVKGVGEDPALSRRLAMTATELRLDPHVSPIMRRLLDPDTRLGQLTHWVMPKLRVPAYSYLWGLYWQMDANRRGIDGYLLGRHSDLGWWYYFPVAFAVKTPTATLILLVMCIALVLMALIRMPRAPLLPWLLSRRFEWFIVTVPLVLYFAVTMLSHVNIGIRHLLPVYPFLFILLSACLFNVRFHRAKRLVAPAVAFITVVLAVESVHIYPNYLSFFNSVSGGSAHGTQYLIDSNIDWGQDLKKLGKYVAARGNPPVCFSYFGNIDPKYYGIDARPLLGEQTENPDCDVAISVNSLYSVDNEFAWLQRVEPSGRIGYSIYYYDRKTLTDARN